MIGKLRLKKKKALVGNYGGSTIGCYAGSMTGIVSSNVMVS